MSNGSNFVLGQANTATLPTVLKAGVPDQPFKGNFRVETKKGGTAIMGQVTGSSAIGVVGSSEDSKGGTGVFGQGEGIGVFGLAIENKGTKDGIGVFGDGGKWGVMGKGREIGVERSVSGSGGIGVWGTGELLLRAVSRRASKPVGRAASSSAIES